MGWKLLKSRTLDKRWPEHVFISGGNPNLTGRFCKDELGQI